VKSNAIRIYNRIKETLGGPRTGPSPSVRSWLEIHGDTPIESISICKKPIFAWIERIGNWISQGKLKENMDKLGYDRLMHLFMIVRLKDGTSVKIEKKSNC
jgi:hypothetical protein